MGNIKNMSSKMEIPAYVSSWTDEYFHKSAFEAPIKYPDKKIIDFLSQFKKKESVKLYRGINKYNGENYIGLESWTYKKEVASRYAKEIGGKVIEKTFKAENILLDTTLLNKDEKIFLGYDYKIDDKEALVII
ncbi:MAG: hypothetical protein Q8N80_03260 [Candidatus Omnitrophota bacterium]|nr:hypothetical protein [Candidatus Omnitrophota bacterium]